MQIVCTLGAFGYLFAVTDVHSLRAAFHKAPLFCVPAAIATLLLVIFGAALRWKLLFVAYGASAPPPLAKLFRLQLVGLFYNMLPGAVGGDVVRGVVSRAAFGERGLSAGLAIVLVERLLGLIALVLLVLGVLSFHDIPRLQVPRPLLMLGLAGGVSAIVAIAAGRRLAHFLPGKLAAYASQLPELSRFGAFLLALCVSVCTQALVGLVGHIVIAPLAPTVSVWDSLVLSPLSFATVFVPVTVAGAGTRDAAMAALYGTVGVPRADALLASLEILLSYVLVGVSGGIVGALAPLDASSANSAATTPPAPSDAA